MTSYIVLVQDGPTPHDRTWQQTGPPYEAISAEAAIRKAASDSESDGTFVAVPMRSWSPVTVTVETKRTVKLS